MENQIKKPELIAYTITKNNDKNYFNRIGVAWANSKGGYKINLTSLPINGEILLLPPKDNDHQN